MYVLDTNAIIYYCRREEAAARERLQEIFSTSPRIYISTVSELELFSAPNLSSQEAEAIEDILTASILIPLDSKIARIAAGLRRMYRIKTPDSVIAATAMMLQAKLVTRNINDFRQIQGLTLEAI